MSNFTLTYKVNLRPKKTRQRLATHPTESASDSQQKPSPLALQLALAYKIERYVENGAIKNYAEAAKLLGISRARMAQITHFLFLPTREQQKIIFSP